MALRWIEGFELYGTVEGSPSQTPLTNGLAAKWSNTYLGGGIWLTTGRVLGKGIVSKSTSEQRLTKTFPSAKTTWIVGFALKQGFTNYDLLRIKNSLTLAVTINGEIEVYNGATLLGKTGGTAGATAPLADNQWHCVELKVVIDAVSGSWELRIDGALSDSGSGVDTGSASDEIEFVLKTTNQYLDDIYICDGEGTTNNDFLGTVFVEGLLPTADGNSSDWTPSSGTDNYALIDENPSDLDGTDSVSTTTAGAKDTYGYGNLTGGQNTILGLQVNTDVRALTSTSQDIKNIARSGTTESEAAAVSVTDEVDFVTIADVYEQDPDTSAAWTPSGLGAAEFGFKKDG